MAKRGKVQEPEILDADEIRAEPGAALEVVEAAKDGTTIIGFMRNLNAFGHEVVALQRQAEATLARAEELKRTPPKTEADDHVVQELAKDAAAQIKIAETKWTITQTVHRLHGTLVSGRKRTVDMLTRARDIGNSLHARYKDDANRAAAAEQERKRRAAEDQARADQEAAAQRLEQEALAREAQSADLSDREEMFVTLVAGGYDANSAAKSAGYKEPVKAAAKLLTLAKITAAIEGKKAAAASRRQAEAVRQQPVEVEVETVQPAVSRGMGVRGDVVTWGYEMLDEGAFIDAVISGKYGLPPREYLTFKPTAVGQLARAMQERLDTIPGLRSKKTTSVR